MSKGSGGGGRPGRTGGGGANYGDTVQQEGDTAWYRDSAGKQTVTKAGKIVYQGEGPWANRGASDAWKENKPKKVLSHTVYKNPYSDF